MLARLFLLIALWLLSNSAFSQTLWRESTYGMTPEQVKSSFPDATIPTVPGTLYGGAVELLTVKGVEIINKKFDASFFFKDNKLTQVTLHLRDEGSSAATRIAYDYLREALRVKYGREVNSTNRSEYMIDTTWMSGNTNIKLVYLNVGGSSPILNINYQVRVASEANKL